MPHDHMDHSRVIFILQYNKSKVTFAYMKLEGHSATVGAELIN